MSPKFAILIFAIHLITNVQSINSSTPTSLNCTALDSAGRCLCPFGYEPGRPGSCSLVACVRDADCSYRFRPSVCVKGACQCPSSPPMAVGKRSEKCRVKIGASGCDDRSWNFCGDRTACRDKVCRCNFGSVPSSLDEVNCEHFNCTTDTQCTELYGENSRCLIQQSGESVCGCWPSMDYEINWKEASCKPRPPRPSWLPRYSSCINATSESNGKCPKNSACIPPNKCECKLGYHETGYLSCEQYWCFTDDDCSKHYPNTACSENHICECSGFYELEEEFGVRCVFKSWWVWLMVGVGLVAVVVAAGAVYVAINRNQQ